MKYLKTFEGFGHLDFHNHLFKQIDYDNFEEMVSSQSISKSCVSEEITDKDVYWFINLMEKNIFSPYQLLSTEKVKRIETDKIESVIRVKLVPKFNDDWTEILLYKFQDEYWVVECMGYGNVYFQGGSDWTYWACDTDRGVEDWCKYYFEHLKGIRKISELGIYLTKESFSNKELLYWETNDLDYDGKIVSVDKSVFNTINSRLKEGFKLELNHVIRSIDLDSYSILLPDTEFYVDIFQLDDEWFDVEILDARDPSYGKTMFNSHYYRCDGVEGLLKFLKDEKIIE